MNSHTAGQLAELTARWFMRLHGYGIIASNVITGRGTHRGEIDFIARRGKTLVFVEVKKRSTTDNAAYALKPVQQQRIRNAAAAFIKRNPQYGDYAIRFDAILIAFPCSVRHIENAW